MCSTVNMVNDNINLKTPMSYVFNTHACKLTSLPHIMVYFLSLDVFVCNAKKSESYSSMHDTLWVMINTNTLSYA